MRATPRKLAATLLTLCSLLLITAPAPAVVVGGGRNHAGRHDAQRSRSANARRLHRAAVHARRVHAKRVHLRRVHVRPTALQNGGTPTAGTLHQRIHHVPALRRHTERAAKKTAAQQGAAVIASVLATPCQSTELTPAPANIPLIREAVLCLVNRVRAEHSVAPLANNPKLEAAAEGHCSELISDDYFAHVSPSGETPVDRIRGTGYIPNSNVGYVIGENLAWGTYNLSTPQAIVAAWVASPGHLANILESQYTETGIGVTPSVPRSLGEGNPGTTYAQEFGVIIH